MTIQERYNHLLNENNALSNENLELVDEINSFRNGLVYYQNLFTGLVDTGIFNEPLRYFT